MNRRLLTVCLSAFMAFSVITPVYAAEAVAAEVSAIGDTTVKAECTSAGIEVSWEEVNGATGYYVYKKQQDSEDSYTRVDDVAGTRWVDENVENNTAYRYSVKAYIKNGSELIVADNISPSALAVYLQPVKGLAYERAIKGIQLKWEKANGVKGYQIYRKAENESDFRYITAVADDVYSDLDVENNTEYSYKVRAYNYDSTENVYYGGFSGIVTTGYIEQVTGVKIEKTDKGIILCWNAIEGARGYQIRRKADNESSPKTVEEASISASWIDEDFDKNIEYEYTVRAYNKSSSGTVYYGTLSQPESTKAKTLEEQVADSFSRFNSMEYYTGCASLMIDKASAAVQAEIGYIKIGSTEAKCTRYKVLDCRSVDDVIIQRHKYFSDEILNDTDSVISSYCAEYEKAVFVAGGTLDPDTWDVSSIVIQSKNESNVTAAAKREVGGVNYEYTVTFSVHDGYVKMESLKLNG